MKNVTYDNYGSGWDWHGTNGNVRKPYKSARNLAIKQFGKNAVETVERICVRGVDRYLLTVVLEQAGLGKLIGCGGYYFPNSDPLFATLVKSPDLDSARFKAYQSACDKLGITKFPNKPPNWELVIRAAENIGDDSFETLGRVGQFGATRGCLADEEKANYKTCYYELIVK